MVTNRRRFLRRAAATGLLTAGTGVGSARPISSEPGTNAGRTRGANADWEWTGGTDARFTDAVRTGDGFLVVGETERDGFPNEGWAVSLGPDGTPRWDRVYRSPEHREWREREADPDDFGGPSFEDCFETVVPDGDGGYVLVGWTYTDSPADLLGWVVGIDAEGAARWESRIDLGDDAYFFTPLYDAARIGDRLLVVGNAAGFTGMQGGEGLLFELDGDGDVRWWNTLSPVDKGHDDPRRDVFRSIVPHGDGYVLVGRTEPEHEDVRGWAVRIDADGAIDWRRQYRSREGARHEFSDGVATDDGLLLGGRAGDGGWVLEVDRAGEPIAERTHEGASVEAVAPGSPPVVVGRRNGRRWATAHGGPALFDASASNSSDGGVGSGFGSAIRTGDGDLLYVGHRGDTADGSSAGWAVRGRGSSGDPEPTPDSHLLVFSYADDHVGSYRFSVEGAVERTDGTGGAPFNRRFVTVDDDEDEVDGSTVTGVVAGGGDAYRISGPLEGFQLERGGDHVFAYLDGRPLDDWTAANAPHHLVIAGGNAADDGLALEYGFAVTGTVGWSGRGRDAPFDDSVVTTDPEDGIAGRTAQGVVAGGVDAFYYSGSIERFRIDDCDGSARAWLDGDAVDPCDLGS